MFVSVKIEFSNKMDKKIYVEGVKLDHKTCLELTKKKKLYLSVV